jgi:uncharacterized small protein (DUF1192 family)
MTIDERIQALTMNLERLSHESEKHDPRIAALLSATERDGEHIHALASIAEIHERRITRIEGGEDE